MAEKAEDENPVGRIGEVSDTSSAIAFLTNDETASFEEVGA